MFCQWSRFTLRLSSHAVTGSEAYGGRVLSIVADANKRLPIFRIGIVPLILASNDGEWRAVSSWISAGRLALYGDVVPSQGAMRVSFDDGFLSRESRYAAKSVARFIMMK